MFDALLMGHDDWVYSARWQPMVYDASTQLMRQPLKVISSSSDKSLMVWSPDEETGLWINDVRVGEMGGNVFTYYNGVFCGDQCDFILAHGYTGAFQVWKRQGESHRWNPVVSFGGHVGPVMDLSWDPTNEYFVTVSSDQTTRLFGQWSRNNHSTWHELGRPQVHGYDLQCLTFIGKYRFASGAEEKVVRVFEMPNTIATSLEHLTQKTGVWERQTSRPVGASLPALGLSNKAVFQEDINSLQQDEFYKQQSYMSATSSPTSLVEVQVQPPFEDHLIQHTLWPEIEKLYGHGYEIFRVRCSRDGKLMATSCKASTPEHAAVRVFCTESFTEICEPLVAHSLTVTNMSFSHSDSLLLTVSRDRSVCLFARDDTQENVLQLVFKAPKAHARIVWDCDWVFDDSFFATGSRDKSVKLWSKDEKEGWQTVATITLDESVTALAFAPCLVQNRFVNNL
jgi:elongator complex protein 2